MRSAILSTVLACALATSSAFGKGSKSSGGGGISGISLTASVHYMHPPPGVLGMSADVNFGRFFRIGTGVGTYVKVFKDTGGEVYVYSLVSTLLWAVSLGNIKWSDAYSHLSGHSKSEVEAVLAPGFDFKLFVPNWKLSPSVGLGYVSWLADPPTSLGLNAEKGNHTYFTTGIDFAGAFGYIGAGVTYSPKMPDKYKVTPYISLGAAIKFGGGSSGGK